jgi:hypothetical protein
MARLQKWTLPGDNDKATVVMYGRTENFNFFAKTPVTDELQECVDGLIKQTAGVKEYNRKRYFGDQTGVRVGPQSDGRKILTGVPRSSGNALPGRTVIFATDPDTWDGGDEKRQFQYVGNFKDLFMHMQSNAGKDIIIYNNTGTRYRVCATEENAG